MRLFLLPFLIALLSISCKQNKTPSPQPVFEVLDSKHTGLDFVNTLTPTDSFNMFNYMYFYNGAGVGAGDFNNDGLIDLFFSSNQGQNKLYLNKGNLQFTDVTVATHIPVDGAWSTGVSIVDINNDGLLDIYVCRVGNFETLHSKNQLLVCKGIDKYGVPFYTDEAKEMGIDFSGFSTQAAFFDYDMDGDLDLYLMNHGIRSVGTFGERQHFIGTFDSLSGDRLYRNDLNTLPNGKGSRGAFTNVTKQSGINSSAIGYGLGICVSDINLDGWPDLYIGNDFHENDYLYINQKDGTFKDELTNEIMHTSQFSMGVDVADINNDAFPEIISMDMLPADPYILKRSLGEDEFNLFNMKLRYGYNPQYARNNLQLNLGNGHFSEIGRYAGIYATDWSWSALWVDFDNDGLKDLFVSNGIPKRLNDMDYVNFVSNENMQDKIRSKNISQQDMSLIDKFPEIKLPNKFFHNKGEAAFDDMGPAIAGDRPSYSNGAVYADLDNDGDLDIVVNNIADPAIVYENKSSQNKSLQVVLKGDEKNRNAVGAKLLIYEGGNIHTYEKFAARGFQSSMEIPLLVGLGKYKIDSAKLVWPDNTCQSLEWKAESNSVQYKYTKGLPAFNYQELTRAHVNPTFPALDITKQTNLLYSHTENNFVEFDREPLMPHMASREGPALAVSDINNDGLEDVFVGSSRGGKSAVFIQQSNGRFLQSNQPALSADSNYEDVSACWADVNNDGAVDLVVGSGGNEYFGPDPNNTPRVYLNDGAAHFTKLQDAFPPIYLTASCVIPYDFNGDGFTDLFIGARAVPFEYGKVPRSYLLMNDGKGKFNDVTDVWNKELANVGFVTSAVWCDINKDNKKDLLVCCEWGGIYAFMNRQDHFERTQVTGSKGWWNFLLPADLDNDGDIDLVAGNLGQNNRLQASAEHPVRMYYDDFDGNGKKEQVLTYYLENREIPFANKGELEKQLPILKKRFLYAEDFAKASLADMFSEDKLKQAELFTADNFSNSILINDGKGEFALQPMPWLAQLSCYKDAVIVHANDDQLPDILLVGNFYANNIQMGRYDADYGTLLINKGKGVFTHENLNGMELKGESRHIAPITMGKKQAYIIVRNNDSLKVIQFAKPGRPLK